MQAVKSYHKHHNLIRSSAAAGRAGAAEKRISPLHRTFLLRTIVMIAILLIVMIGFMAYSVQIRYNINETNNQIAQLQSRIDELNLQINEVATPAMIESRAKELGMVYPSMDQRRYLNTGNEGVAYAEASPQEE